MKIFICCSKHFYDRIPQIKSELEKNGHRITLPNSYDSPLKEEEVKRKSKEEHVKWKSEMIRAQKEKIRNNDAILVLNYEKNGLKNYIGGATFLEIYEGWQMNKKLFLYNEIPEGMLKDEITAFAPKIIHGNLEEII